MKSPKPSAPFLLALFAIAACSSTAPGAGDGGNGDGGTDGGASCQDLANAYCTTYQGCAPSQLLRDFGSLATCLAQEQASCTLGLAAPGTSRTPAKVEACAQAYGTWSCYDFFANNPPAACLPTPGLIADGGVCVVASQCATAFCLLPSETGVCGICQAPPAAGASCRTTNCPRGLLCGTATKTCEVVQGDGGRCLDSDACNVGLTCFGFDGGNGSGTCLPAATGTEVCDFRDLTGLNCDNRGGYVCISQACIPAPLADAGEACSRIDAGPPPCDAGSTCIVTGPIGCQSGACVESAGVATCMAPAANGAPCDLALGPTCLELSKCVVDAGTAGTCQLPNSSLCGG